ncbi:hypothetical protein ACQUQP_02270 [Marinobacterium sp. YM272]|uniref:HTH domain-containing protein n=1 Tax=Marinobacterium sp. YM272 TaxID=3421654 RepID=UPI003D7F3699
MPLSDRADNILALLLAEPILEHGNIIFVAHSLGGLVVEQILRSADRDSGHSAQAESLLSRVRRVAFLGTPHRGALLANLSKLLKLVVRPSSSTRDLVLNNPQLRDLNHWYRKYCQQNNLQNLVLAEGRSESIWGFSLPEAAGKIVWSCSSDPGVAELPIVVDESHMTICTPSSRDAEVYRHLKNFISSPFGPPSQVAQTVEALDRTNTQLAELTASSQSQSSAINELTRSVAQGMSVSAFNTDLIDLEVERRREHLRKSRLFATFNIEEQTQSLVEDLRSGSLASASKQAKDTAFACCARFLSVVAPEDARSILDSITSPETELAVIARSLLEANSGQLDKALGSLAGSNSAISRGAAYICVLKARGFHEACDWLQQAQLSVSDLDSDAKLFYLQAALDSGEWSAALEVAETVSSEDLDRTPALIFGSANAFLMQAVPDELRISLLQYLPIDTASFPLRSEPENLTYRRTAARLFEHMREVADALELPSIAGLTDDRGLWLRLMDPDTTQEAQQELAASIKDPATLLRRLNLAIQFGVEIDLLQAEKEVDRQTALSGGTSLHAATARFALAFTRKSHADAAAYIDQHRNQLLEHLHWKGIYFFEIEMLSRSGQTAKAQVRLQESIERGLTDDESRRLRNQLAKAEGHDPIAELLAIYEQSKSITDLRLLVDTYEETKNWARVAEYGRLLLDQTGDIANARRCVIALYKEELLDDALAVFASYPTLISQYPELHLLQAEIFFEKGTLDQARSELDTLRQANDSAEARQLQVNLSIVSGDWESLQSFVESEWSNRADRSAHELIRDASIAQLIGAARGEVLIREAAIKAPDDPVVLMNCYEQASKAGWEHRPEVCNWLGRAASLSQENGEGPVQTMSIEDLIEQKPSWQEREINTSSQLAQGLMPIFMAGRLLNRTLLSLFLRPAICNLSEMDVRRRPLIYGFSGTRKTYDIDPQVIAMDPTALMTTEFLGILDLCIEKFERIVIPHETLGWLLQEKAQLLFHQPSRVEAARDLRRMISEKQLYPFEGNATPPEHLVHEIGEELATLLAEASSHVDERQRLVVRGGPVYKVSTFMKEEADLSSYEAFLCSCTDVVDKLVQKGVLTSSESEKAYSALNVREKPWPTQHEISDGAILYLDDLAVSHLDFLDLLPKLHRANITVVISRNEIQEADALIAYDAKGADVVAIVDRLRSHVRSGLESGKVKLARAVRGDHKDQYQDVMTHPTLAMLKLMDEAEAGVIDDRYVNQHKTLSSETAYRPILSTLDVLAILLARGEISKQQVRDARTTLRQANFALIPLDVAELTEILSATPVTNSFPTETAEFRAVRENILSIRMSETLQLPRELAWLNATLRACLLAIRDQWKSGPGFDEQAAATRSDWLLELSDIRGWAHLANIDTARLIEQYRAWLSCLMLLPVEQPASVREAYWRWFEGRVLNPLAEKDPQSYATLVERAKEFVKRGSEISVKYQRAEDD